MDPELKGLIESTATETWRHFDVVAEGLQQKIQLLAEGITANTQRIERLSGEMKEEFAEVRSTIRLSHTELERRLRTLEDVVSTLQSRMDRLEGTLGQ